MLLRRGWFARRLESIWRPVMRAWEWLIHLPRRKEELDEEIQSHLRMAAEERMKQGESAEQARTAALREFGNIGLVKEVTRDMWGWSWLETLLQDLRYGLRQLSRSPGFTVVVVLTLALGIGANSTVFSVLNGLFLRALPVPEPERLVTFSDTNFSWGDYVSYRDQAKSFASLSTSYAFPFTANLNSTRPPSTSTEGSSPGISSPLCRSSRF